MKKVLHITIGLEFGGTENMIAMLLPNLEGEHILVALKGDGPIGERLRQNGIKVIPLYGKGKMDLSIIGRLYKIIKEEKPNIIHTYLYYANILGTLLGKLANVPIMLTSLEALDVWLKGHHKFLLRICGNYQKVFITCAKKVEESYTNRVGLPANKMRLIYHPMDIIRFSPKEYYNTNKNKIIIGAVSRLDEPTKGLQVLLHSLPYILKDIKKNKKNLEIEVWLIGDGPSHQLLENLTQKLGLTSIVKFLGSRNDIPELLQQLDIFVMPSLWEGAPNALLEAMSTALPIVATNVGGIPELAEHNKSALLVPSKNPEAIANAILYLINNPSEAQKLAKEARKQIEKRFAMPIIVKQLNDLYDELS